MNIKVDGPLVEAVQTVLDHIGEDAQVFYSETGGLVLTDQYTYEIYWVRDAFTVLRGTIERGAGWEDISDEVFPVSGPADDEYAEREWTGSETAVIESGTWPWVQDPDGKPVVFGDGVKLTRIVRGLYAKGTSVMRDDVAPRFDSDLHAAQHLATNATKLFGRKHTVWYHGTK